MTSTTITTQLGLIKTNEIDLKKVEKDIKKIIHTDPCCNMDYVYDEGEKEIEDEMLENLCEEGHNFRESMTELNDRYMKEREERKTGMKKLMKNLKKQQKKQDKRWDQLEEMCGRLEKENKELKQEYQKSILIPKEEYDIIKDPISKMYDVCDDCEDHFDMNEEEVKNFHKLMTKHFPF